MRQAIVNHINIPFQFAVTVQASWTITICHQSIDFFFYLPYNHYTFVIFRRI